MRNKSRFGAFAALMGAAVVLLGTPSFAVPSPALTYGLRGYFLEAAGDNEGAIAALREAAAADPESVELGVSLAQLLGVRNPTAALDVVDRGLQHRPGNPRLLLLRARLLEYLGKRDEAAAAWIEASEKGGGDEAFAGAVRVLHQTPGRGAEGVDAARRWTRHSPKNPQAFFTLGYVLLRSGDNEGAKKALERALELAPSDLGSLRALAVMQQEAGNDEAAAELYRRLVKANPHDVDAWFRLAQVLTKMRQTDEAAKVLQEVRRWAGSDPALSLHLALLFLQAEKPAEAEAELRPQVQANPNDTRAWYLLGVSLLAQEKHEAALAAFERIPETAGEYQEALARRAAALRGLKRAGEAVRLVKDWLRSHPEDEATLLALAELLDEEGDSKAAVELLEAHVAGKPTKNYRIYFTLGVLWEKLKDWRKTAEYMRQSLERNPDDPHALNFLGYTYAEQGVNLEEAEKLIVRALELDPDDGAITDSLGWVYYRQGRYQEAVAALRRAAELLPKDGVVWEHLGDALKAFGQVGEAKKVYERALELVPASETLKGKLRELP